MARFRSVKYPQLVVHGVTRFVDGVVEVNAAAAKELRKLEHLGVVEVKPAKTTKTAVVPGTTTAGE